VEALDIRAVIEDVVGLSCVDAMAHGVSLRCECPSGSPTLQADRVRVGHVVLDLLGCALEALAGSAQTGGVITVRVENRRQSVLVLTGINTR
jgi:C4-dicarboxylate-specific signal transduction histidine kinase